MTTKTITEERVAHVCDMCKKTELTSEPLQLGSTYADLHYQVIKAFEMGDEWEGKISYKSHPNHTVFLEQRTLFREKDTFKLCYSCYDKLRVFIQNCDTEDVITISTQHAFSLSEMVKAFKKTMLVADLPETELRTDELTDAYCDELLEALK
jgi:hypothetical protein